MKILELIIPAALLLFGHSCQAQDDLTIGCFVPGECTESVYIGASEEQTPEDCLQYCKVWQLI